MVAYGTPPVCEPRWGARFLGPRPRLARARHASLADRRSRISGPRSSATRPGGSPRRARGGREERGEAPPRQSELEKEISKRIAALGKEADPSTVRLYARQMLAGY